MKVPGSNGVFRLFIKLFSWIPCTGKSLLFKVHLWCWVQNSHAHRWGLGGGSAAAPCVGRGNTSRACLWPFVTVNTLHMAFLCSSLVDLSFPYNSLSLLWFWWRCWIPTHERRILFKNKNIVLWAIPLPGLYPEGVRAGTLMGALYPYAHGSIITVPRWERPKCPLADEWIDENVVYMYNGMLFCLKKGWNSDTATCYNRGAPQQCHIRWNKADMKG